MNTATVADVMTTDVCCARAPMPLKEVARVLHEHGISALPVLDADDRVIGIVSEHDVLPVQAGPPPRRRWALPGRRGHDRERGGDTAGHVMSAPAVTTGPDAPLALAARTMLERDVTHLPVTDRDGRLVGIVGRRDLLGVFLRSDDEIRTEVVDEVLVHLLWQDPVDVRVEVRDGVVTLTGPVDETSTVAAAERLSRRVDGVVDVVNRLQARTTR